MTIEPPRYPDPARPLVAHEPYKPYFKGDFSPASADQVGPVWAITFAMIEVLDAYGNLTPETRVEIYRQMAEQFLAAYGTGSGSSIERHSHYALQHLAQMLAVQNAG